ncbi:UDP-N-acetylglucosamine 2-epimerase (non-hydrolyzing) [Candidatus Woesearchaeota archaeon]|nr:UDP-N-acetylglucosamine 2-epimerase (non-hydrolyzing) [Candidatus Woesearchaeota archaeon]
MLKIINVVGTRPNFIKIAPLIKEMKKHKDINPILIHTGQHYDASMSKAFFEDLNIPKPNLNLEVGSASDAAQTAKIMLKFEKALLKEKPDLVLVVGDVNSTFAAAITAKKCGIKVAHVESGLRSFDMKMPEEINRILTDHVSDFLFTTEKSANQNLINEGIDKKKILYVGNVMIDTLISHREKAKKSRILQKLGLYKKEYAVLTLHRPSNVDDNESFKSIFNILNKVQRKIKIVFPIHPRTLKNLKKHCLLESLKSKKSIVLTEPLGYLDFLSLMINSKFVITDSGGIQEETTVLNVPCVTIRNTTERPITTTEGTNVLVSTDEDKILNSCNHIIKGVNVKSKIPKLWDGKAADRIINILLANLGRNHQT